MALGEYEDAIETTLIPPGMQYGATHGIPEQRKPLRNADLQTRATSCNA
jgi:hypothetical protein